MAAVSNYSPTGNPYLDGLLMGTKWGTSQLTYSFPSDPLFYGSTYGSSEPTKNFGAFSAYQQMAMRNVLSLYSSVANLSFVEIAESTSTHADLRFAESDGPSTAWGY